MYGCTQNSTESQPMQLIPWQLANKIGIHHTYVCILGTLTCAHMAASLKFAIKENVYTLSDKLWLVPSCTTKWIGGSRVTAYPAHLMTRPNTTNRYTPTKPHTPNHSLHEIHLHMHMYYIICAYMLDTTVSTYLSPVLMKMQVHLLQLHFAYDTC